MDSKHTKGLWKIGRENWVVAGDGSVAIAKVGQAHANFGEQEANLKLISAAPELLGACEKLFERLTDNDVHSLVGHDLCTEVYNAIAKAK